MLTRPTSPIINASAPGAWVLTNMLAGYWGNGYTSITPTSVVGGSGMNATLASPAQWYFDTMLGRPSFTFATTQRLTLPISATLRPNNLSVAFWHKFSTSDYLYPIDVNKDATDSLTVQYAQTAEKAIYVTIPGVVQDARWDIGTLAGSWHHVAVTYDGAHVTLYVDGAVVGSPLAKTGNCAWNTTYPIVVGGERGTTAATPAISDIALWSAGLTAAQVALLANINWSVNYGGTIVMPGNLVRPEPRAIVRKLIGVAS